MSEEQWSVVSKVPMSPKVGGGTNWAYKIKRGKYSTEVTVESHAYLIAAAPDMLKVLERLKDCIVPCRCDDPEECYHARDAEGCGLIFSSGADAAIGEILAAIRKAEKGEDRE